MTGDKRKKKIRGAAVIKKTKNIVINIKTGGAKRRASQPRATRAMVPAPTAPQLAPTSINIAVSQQQQQQQGQFTGIPFRSRPPSSGTNVVATFRSPLAWLAPPPAAPIIIQQVPAPIKKEKEEPKQHVVPLPTEAQQALSRRVGQLEQYGRQIYTMVAPIVAESGSVRRRANQQVPVHASNDDDLTDSSVSVNVPRPLIMPQKYAGLVQQGHSAPRNSPIVSASEQGGFEAEQTVESDPQAHFAAQYIHSAAAPEKGGRGRPRLTPSQLEARAADKVARVTKPRGVKSGTGWTAARRAAFEANKLLRGMPMQTQAQAAAIIQADAAPIVRKPKIMSKAAARGGAVRLNPALSGSEQVSQLAQAGVAAVPQQQSRGMSIEQMARDGGNVSDSWLWN